VNDKIKNYLERIIKKSDALIEEIEKDKNEFIDYYKKKYKEKEGYILKENISSYDQEIEAVNDFKEMISKLDIERFNTKKEFKELMLQELDVMYNKVTRLRAGIRMLIETVKSTFE